VVTQPATAPRLDPVSTVLACRRYYLDGASKSEIAAELGISRFRVARLLERARRDGIVRIEIDPLPELDLALADEVSRRHGLRSAVVVRSSDAPDELRLARLGRAAAAVLVDSLDANDVLGISWGRTLHAMVAHLPRLPACTVVQLVGSVPAIDLEVNSLELVRRLAERATGPVYPLHLPLLVHDPGMADALRSDPHVSRTLEMFDRLTRAVVGIGAWQPGGSTVRAALSAPDALATDVAGGVADICSIVLDADGDEVAAAGLPSRCLAIRSDQLRLVPDVIAIADGTDKVRAIHAVLASGLVHRLVTGEDVARRLLADQGPPLTRSSTR
jgi:DNA-binding transcriptional regulator LsrR (DeoR family)